MTRRLPFRTYAGLAAAITAAAVFATSPCAAQSASDLRESPDTGLALTAEMRLLDQKLLERTRVPLERWGNTFMAFAMYVPDTLGPNQVFEIGPATFIESRQPGAHRDSLRSAMRTHERQNSPARAVGIIADSIAGPVEEAVDGADGPDFPRMAITELEDRLGRCRRIVRDYRFVKEPRGDWGFGTVVFDSARITRCQPYGYWPPDSGSTRVSEPARPHLAAPIVKQLDISSLENYFTVVGEFHGTLTVFDDSIVVQFDTLLATRRLAHDSRAVRLDSIRVGVGMGSETAWSPVDDSQALRINRALPKGSKIVRHAVRFVMKHERRDEDTNAWIVVTFHIRAGHPGEPEYSPQATTYAHSARGVLVAPASTQ